MSNRINPNPDAVELGMEVILAEEEMAVYVKITGFETVKEADDYGEYLLDTLPLMLFESEVKH